MNNTWMLRDDDHIRRNARKLGGGPTMTWYLHAGHLYADCKDRVLTWMGEYESACLKYTKEWGYLPWRGV